MTRPPDSSAPADLPERWFPHHTGGVIDPVARAVLYPYPAPTGDFFMRDGLPVEAPGGAKGGIPPEALEGRVPVLSVGSNRAPLQLRRKFGAEASLPVTACRLIGADVVFAATLSAYCAAPATAYPSPGAAAYLNIAWLDGRQLSRMHATEAVGHAYDFVRFDAGVVDHGERPDAAVFTQPVYGYEARSGVFADDDGRPIAQGGITATGRCFAAYTQPQMLTRIKHIMGAGDEGLEAWIKSLLARRQAWEAVIETLAERAITPANPPWQVVAGCPTTPEDLL